MLYKIEIHFNPTLTYGRCRSLTPKTFISRYALYVPKCLSFKAIFKQDVFESLISFSNKTIYNININRKICWSAHNSTTPRPIWPIHFLKCLLKSKGGFYGKGNSNNGRENPKDCIFL